MGSAQNHIHLLAELAKSFKYLKIELQRLTIADFERFLTLVPIARERRSLLREGYAALLELGWPTSYIDWKMCERACAGLVSRYKGGESWARYKEQWAGEDCKRRQ